MHLLGNCVLIVGLAAFVIVGFLNVLKDLLSRDIFDAPSWSSEERALEIAEGARPFFLSADGLKETDVRSRLV
jgi:hypothetical protein